MFKICKFYIALGITERLIEGWVKVKIPKLLTLMAFPYLNFFAIYAPFNN